MLIDLSIGLLCAFVGFAGAIWLLLVAFGDGMTDPAAPFEDDPISATDRAEVDEMPGPFIPMPGHLRTQDEMVDWMTKELPRLTAMILQSGSRDRTR